MCLLRSRVRSPSSAGRRLAGNVPGEAEVEEPADLSQVRNERVSRGEALTAVYLSHRVSAGPMAARTRCLTGDTRGRIQFLR